MTRLYVEKSGVKTVDFGLESTLPMLAGVNTNDDTMPSELPEGDGLYLGYNFLKSAFPYKAQDNYSRELTGDTLQTVVLENARLKASFAPSLGGKLWSVFDKDKGRELLFSNPVARPAYLATRNAWCSGGVEWNCGIFGHTPFTCSPLFASTLTMADGTPVLRMYEFERVRGVVYQMDFFLPEDSKVLYARMRVVNPSFRATTMYWWSNIAVPHVDGARVVVPAEGAYTHVGNNVMTVVPIPVRDGLDVTYPDNNPVSIDYFFRTDKRRRMYHCQLSPEGYGLFESSTSRLVGRKIFVWGQGPGGRKWQEYLSGEGSDGKYCEIQCGLAHTQSEHLPMPPATAWEWMEIYGPMNADGKKVHGDWDGARAEVEKRIDEIITADALEKLLDSTRGMALTPAGELISRGKGWGALENIRRERAALKKMCPHLDFGEPGEEQEAWLSLLDTGSMGKHDGGAAPKSYMRQREWTRMMEDAVAPGGRDENNAYTLYQLGCTYLAEPDMLRARMYIDKSLKLKRTAWALYALSEIQRIEGDSAAAAKTMLEAAELAPEDGSVAKIAARLLNDLGEWELLEKFTGGRSEEIKRLPRIKLYRACALAHTGRIAEAEEILINGGDYLQVPDIQEGETALSDLWYCIQDVKNGSPVDRDRVSPPYALDFRMFAKH